MLQGPCAFSSLLRPFIPVELHKSRASPKQLALVKTRRREIDNKRPRHGGEEETSEGSTRVLRRLARFRSSVSFQGTKPYFYEKISELFHNPGSPC